MNEEEKEAIKKVKEIIYNPEYGNIILFDSEGFTGWNINFEIILNLIDKQQKEIEKLKGKNKELFEEYNKRVSEIIVYEQGLKEIIDEEDDPHTWAYHAVKKLLEEVGGIEYE